MKNLSLILNIVLLIAVGVLFYLHFSGGNGGSVQTASGATLPSDVRIAYINSDSVLKHYEYLKVNREKIEEKAKKFEQEYRNRASGLQSEFNAYQRNVNTMTLGQVRAVEEDLQKKQQNLQMYQQTLSQQIMEEEAKLNKDLYDRVTAFLKKYGEEKGLHVVLKYDPTSDVLFGVPALDISQDVINGLNSAYGSEGTGTAKSDTTKTN